MTNRRCIASLVGLALAWIALASACRQQRPAVRDAGQTARPAHSLATPDAQQHARAVSTPSHGRAPLLGFTPWPYAATQEAIAWTYRAINEAGDLVSHHLEEGVPWPEALAGEPFAPGYQRSLDERRAATGAGKVVFLSLSPINTARDGLALYRDAAINSPLPAAWATRELDSPEVKAAYLAYLRRMVELFHPAYLAVGVEVNLLLRNRPALWPRYLELHRHVYRELKRSHPALIILASLDVNPLLDGYSSDDHAAQRRALRELVPYVDQLGVSLHPALSLHGADLLPADLFDQVFALASKPIAITECSYPAQEWSITVRGARVTIKGAPGKQEAFVSRLLAAAEAHGAPFVVYFTIRDYDALWVTLGRSDASLPWRDTGLYDEAGIPRPALAPWIARLRAARASRGARR